MKLSRFSHIFNSEKYGYLLYNSASNIFAEVDKYVYDAFQKIQKMSNCHDAEKEFDPFMAEILRRNRVLVENNADEIAELKMNASILALDKRALSLTLAPTSDCNFKCPYCFEKRPKIYMTEETEDMIIRFVKKYQGLRNLYVTWYGGEPLLAFDTMKRLTRKFLSLGIKYSADIITNGYLLDEKTIEALLELKIDQVQITVDGPEEIHNKRRIHISESDSFEKITSNIDFLLKSSWVGSLSIRVNIDAENREFFPEVYNYFKKKYSENLLETKHINIYPAPVSKITESCSSAGGCMGGPEFAEYALSLYHNHDVKTVSLFPSMSLGGCVATRLAAYVVGPEGELYKCWNDVGNKAMTVGSVYPGKEVNMQLMAKYMFGTDVFDIPACRECFFLPVCMGGCAYSRMQNKYFDAGIDTCVKFKHNLEQYLEAHYELKKRIEKSADTKQEEK